MCLTGEQRGYAEKKQKICVGTQSRNRRFAWVRREEIGDLRGYAEQKEETYMGTQSNKGLGAYAQ